MSIEKREAARLMRNLSDTDRDELIAAAGNVIDLRAGFNEKQKQAALSQAYRRPTGGGIA